MTITPLEALNFAKAASEVASLRVWERDGKMDCGSCGSCVTLLDGRSKLAKVALEQGMAFTTGGDIYLNHFIADGIRSQNADIDQEAGRAAVNSLKASGYGKAIKKFWTYID